MILAHLDLFSGIGGFALGLQWAGGFETVAFCECDDYPRRILAKHWPGVPIYDDVRILNGGSVGPVDIITGGYPCQPFSAAGQRRGQADDRHLWPEMFRLVQELRPAWVIGENVAGHISMGLDDVLSDLDAIGYAAIAFVVPAAAVGAPHKRDRVWIVANADGQRQSQPSGTVADIGRRPGDCGIQAAADAIGDGSQGQQSPWPEKGPAIRGGGRTIPESRLGRVHDGLSARLDAHGFGPDWESGIPRTAKPRKGDNRANRLKALGNAVVPQIPMLIGAAIYEAHHA